MHGHTHWSAVARTTPWYLPQKWNYPHAKRFSVSIPRAAKLFLLSMVVFGFFGLGTTIMRLRAGSLPDISDVIRISMLSVFPIPYFVTMWLRGKFCSDRPVMVLDVHGFWHRRHGITIPWSKLRFNKTPFGEEIKVGYPWNWIVIDPSWFVDRDGVRCSTDTLYREMIAYWARWHRL